MQFQTQILLLSFSCKGVIEEHHRLKRAYLLFVGIYKLHVELQFLSQFLKCSRPVLMLPVPVLNGLAQPLENNKIRVNIESYYYHFKICNSISKWTGSYIALYSLCNLTFIKFQITA